MLPDRIVARTGAVAALGALAVVALAGSASAHVSVSASDTAVGSESLLTFSVPHGCDGSATTRIVISMPREVIEATPTRNAFYRVTKKTVTLDQPITAADGDQITEKVDTVTYTARTPLPDGYRDALDIQIQVPDGVGQRLAFPTIQKCAKGQTAWTEIPAAGQDPESLDHPAPSFVVTAADPAATTVASEGGGAPRGWLIAAMVLSVVGAVSGVTALVRSRRSA